MIAFVIPGPLREFTGGRGRVEVAAPAASVREALVRLWEVHPGVRDRVVTEQGEVRPHVNVFVGAESIRFSGGLDTPLADGAEIWIVPAVSGGSRMANWPRGQLAPGSSFTRPRPYLTNGTNRGTRRRYSRYASPKWSRNNASS